MASGKCSGFFPSDDRYSAGLQGLDNRRCQRIKVSKRNWIRAAILSMGATKWLEFWERSFTTFIPRYLSDHVRRACAHPDPLGEQYLETA